MTDKRKAALEDLDLLEEIGWFPEQDDAGLQRRFDRIREALSEAPEVVSVEELSDHIKEECGNKLNRSMVIDFIGTCYPHGLIIGGDNG